jgi:integrase
MAQILNRLSQAKVTHAKTGIWPDGAGLYLQVTPNGSKSWFFRFTRGDRERRMGLGSLHDVGLAAARQLASEARRLHEAGIDPIVARDAERQAKAETAPTFEQLFEQFFTVKRDDLSNHKHAEQWRSTMKTYVFPAIGHRPVADVMPGEVIDLLKPIWRDKPETARRVLQRINAVFTSAIVRHKRTSGNPCIGVAKELGDNRSGVVHHRSMAYGDVPAFLAQLRESNVWPSTRLAFEWLVLTATRSGEARGATWGEIDEAKALWVIPSERMKTRRKRKDPHRVPLPPRCMDILAALKVLFPSQPADLLFPSMHAGKPLSDMTLTKALRDMGLGEIATVHGFRSSFKVWCAEVAKARDEVSEAALAHVDPNEVRDAYRRTDFLEERRDLMRDWAMWCRVLA